MQPTWQDVMYLCIIHQHSMPLSAHNYENVCHVLVLVWGLITYSTYTMPSIPAHVQLATQYVHVYLFSIPTYQVGCTPLHAASHNGQVAVVEVLLNYDNVEVDATFRVGMLFGAVFLRCTYVEGGLQCMLKHMQINCMASLDIHFGHKQTEMMNREGKEGGKATFQQFNNYYLQLITYCTYYTYHTYHTQHTCIPYILCICTCSCVQVVMVGSHAC